MKFFYTYKKAEFQIQNWLISTTANLQYTLHLHAKYLWNLIMELWTCQQIANSKMQIY